LHACVCVHFLASTSLEHLEPTESQDLLLLDLPWPGRVRLVL
jgi:hypothetical protein